MLGFKGLRSGAQDIAKDVNFYCFKCYAPKIKAFFFVQKIDIIQKIQSQFPKIQNKKPFVCPFLSPKRFKLTSL